MPISILFIDIDNFKKHNDTYGHMQGDLALQTVAKVLTRELKRSLDFVARWGGEEFVILLVNTENNGAALVAERIRKSVEETPILLIDGRTANISVSIGLNTEIPAPDGLLDDFIRNADDALYTAKKEGKNRVCRYNASLPAK